MHIESKCPNHFSHLITLLVIVVSGYVSVGDSDGRKMYEHYLFFESEGDPKKDPFLGVPACIAF